MSTIHATYALSATARLEIARGDLLAEPVDAIVNAANSHLAHGGGIAYAISTKGGPVIDQESEEWVRKHGPVSHAEPAVTGGGKLPARYVIHAVGPVWGSGEEDRKLAEAVIGSLGRADELKLRSIAFPAISTGIFRFPVELAARVICAAVRAYFNEHPQSGIELVRLTLWEEATLNAFLNGCGHASD